MVLRSKPRSLRLASLALPFVVTVGGMSACNPKSGDDGRTSNPPAVEDVALPESGATVSAPGPDVVEPRRPEPAGNPPPPEPVVHPEPVKAPAPTIGRDENGECWQEVEANCPPPEEGTTCNPPAPLKVLCPTDPTKLRYDYLKPMPAPELPTANPPAPRPVDVPVTPTPVPTAP